VHCDGPTPYDPRKFVRDLIRELRKRAGQYEEPPCFPQKSWWCALAIADERDTFRFISSFNARDDTNYFERQHASSTTTPAINKDGFSNTFTHRTVGGTICIAPQIDTYTAPPNLHDRYRRNFADKPGRRAAAAETR
jgi:hypothetical protein